jgi:hypothetical protein
MEMERKMKISRGLTLFLVGALLVAAPAAWAQTSVSSFTIPVSGTIAPSPVASSAAAAGAEGVVFSG